ncbi:MAG: hypothetical protein K0R54_1600 [Clostridiaceae bacterium]|nr:hypothetical protein [Clostridiaceae bacterium]
MEEKLLSEFEEQKKFQLEVLNENIILGDNTAFKVFDHEAGLGKSLQAEKSMTKAWKQHGRKTLYVTLFKDTVPEASAHARINKYAGEDIAVAIDSDNKHQIDKYMEYPILIITHERYKLLCKDNSLWNKYTKGRTTLIIDEMPNMVEVHEYSIDRIGQFANTLPRGAVQDQYNKCVKELEDYLKDSRGKSFFNCKESSEENFKLLKQLIEANIDNRYASEKYLRFSKCNSETLDVEESTLQMTKDMFLNEVEILQSFYRNTSCVDNKKAWTFDYRLRYKKLENNIMMDANARFSILYKLDSELFKLQSQSRIVNHSNWTLNIFRVNTNANAKKQYNDFYDKVKGVIDKQGKEKFLVIGSKTDEKYFNDVTIDHFGNIIGRNNWRGFNKIAIIHNFQTPFYVYALKYMYYSRRKLNNRSTWNTERSRENKSVVMKNDELEKVRISDLASHIYQAIKRINRDNEQEATVFLFNGDEGILNIVKRQFKNIRIRECSEIIINKKENENKKVENDADIYSKRFLRLLKEISYGIHKKEEIRPDTYKKKWCMEKIGYKDNTHFARDVLRKDEVHSFLSENDIKTGGSVIRFANPILERINEIVA